MVGPNMNNSVPFSQTLNAQGTHGLMNRPQGPGQSTLNQGNMGANVGAAQEKLQEALKNRQMEVK